jgi:hypothetical protein
MKVLFSSTVFIFAIVPAAFAGFYASPAVVDVHVIGCQTYPLEGMRVMLVGEAVSEDPASTASWYTMNSATSTTSRS